MSKSAPAVIRRSSRPSLGIVVISRNEGVRLERTVENFRDTAGHAGIVVVDDGSQDGSADAVRRKHPKVAVLRGAGLGVTRARNWGASQVRGDFLVFADAHLELPGGWWKPLVELAREPEVGAVAPAISDMQPSSFLGCGLTFRNPQMDIRWIKSRKKAGLEVPIVPGCCLVMRREVHSAIGGWDEGLLHRGNVDNELSVRLWLLGYSLMISPETKVRHLFRRRSPYRTGWPEYLHNRMRLAMVHFRPERIARVMQSLAEHPFFGQALLLAAAGDSAGRRDAMMARRVRSDDWYFERFGLKW